MLTGSELGFLARESKKKMQDLATFG